MTNFGRWSCEAQTKRIDPSAGTSIFAQWVPDETSSICRKNYIPKADTKSALEKDNLRTTPNLRRSEMEIKRIGSRPSGKGPAEWFTGAVRIDPLFEAPEPARVACASVTFEPGARTAWHTHPFGQTLVVTAGCGWAQRWGG